MISSTAAVTAATVTPKCSNAAAAGARQIARVQGLKLQHHGKLGRALDLMLDDVAGDLRR